MEANTASVQGIYWLTTVSQAVKSSQEIPQVAHQVNDQVNNVPLSVNGIS